MYRAGILSLLLAAVVVMACGQETAIHHARLTVTTWEMAAVPRDSTPPIRFVGVDSVWSAPGRPGAGGVRSSLAGPVSEGDPEWEPVRSMLLAMASDARLTPEDSISVSDQASRISRDWLLEMPVEAGTRIRGRYPVSYERAESGAWVGQGRVRRDFLWIRRSEEIPDTIRIRLDGTLTDTVEVVREGRTLEAEGTIFVASMGRTLDLTLRMRGVVTRIPEAEVRRRRMETTESLEGSLGGPER